MGRGEEHALAAETCEVTLGIIHKKVCGDDALIPTKDDIERGNKWKMFSQPRELEAAGRGILHRGRHDENVETFGEPFDGVLRARHDGEVPEYFALM